MFWMWTDYWQSWMKEGLSQTYTSNRRTAPFPATQPLETAPPSPSESDFPFAFWPFEQALCQLDDALEIVHATENFAHTVGVGPYQVPTLFHDLLTPDSCKQYLYCLQEVLFAPQPRLMPMLRARTREKPAHWVHISGVRHGEGVLLSVRDVTQEMQLERELVRSRINAELAQRSRSEFLGRMSHELRTPLNAVIGFAQMIGSEVNGPMNHPVYEEYLANIRESGTQLLDKINNLLAISEAELGEVQMQEEAVSLYTVLRNASEHHQHFAFSKDIQLTLGSEEDSCPLIMVDSVLMAKALSNLIENALSCTRPGGSVRLECEVDAARQIQIHVRDTGIGMAESLVRCLQEFFSGQYGINTCYELPLGTGLVLTREYLQLHDAKLSVRSEKGNGAVFTVVLPPNRLIDERPKAHLISRAGEALAV